MFSALVIATPFTLTSCVDSSVVASTIYGKVRGSNEDGILSFKGVPYAKTPVGELRFAPPHNPDNWSNVKDCTQYGEACIQDDIGTGWYIQPQGEDCLNLNIWTPTLNPSTPMAVYVYIHGGVFTVGSGNQEIFDGHNMANDLGKKDMVVVDVNYRLHALGFMALGCLEATALDDLDRPIMGTDGEPIKTDGNWGILDQIKALQWIHKNIQYFGGDSANVTVAGESAGSFSVSSLIISPATAPNVQSDGKELFQRAIMESGNLLGYDSIGTVTGANKYRAILQCRTMLLKCLYMDDSNLTADYLRDEASARQLASWTRVKWNPLDQPTFETWNLMPCYDGWALPTDKVAAITEGKFRNVDIIYGWNTEEGYGFIPTGTPIDIDTFKIQIQERMAISDGQDYINALNGFASDPIDAGSPGLIPDPDANSYYWAAERQLIKLSAFASSSKEFVDQIEEVHSGATAKSHWAYNFDYTFDYPTNYGNESGAAHTAELAFVFGNILKNNSRAIDMSNNVMTYWTNFAKTGNPNGSGLTEWELDTEGNENNALWFKGNALTGDVDNQISFGLMDENAAVNAVASFYSSQFII